jgi:bifunctional non-homologous end joining protein LigD
MFLVMDVAGVTVTKGDRPLFDRPRVTKLDLARYLEAVAPWMVPHVDGRPLTLVRCAGRVAEGCQFMRHARAWGPSPLLRVAIREKTKVGEYLVARTPAALVALAQMGVVEIHTWNTRIDDVERPDRIVLDLDPGPSVTWPEVVQAGLAVRDGLAALGLASWAKTTGGAGLHVVVPLRPERPWDECLAFARGFAELVAGGAPDRFTTNFVKHGREEKILLDYLRNNRTNTSVAAYSPRAREGAPVSWPVSWRELSRRPAVSVADAPTRLRRRKDPWAGYFDADQSISARLMRTIARR